MTVKDKAKSAVYKYVNQCEQKEKEVIDLVYKKYFEQLNKALPTNTEEKVKAKIKSKQKKRKESKGGMGKGSIHELSEGNIQVSIDRIQKGENSSEAYGAIEPQIYNVPAIDQSFNSIHNKSGDLEAPENIYSIQSGAAN